MTLIVGYADTESVILLSDTKVVNKTEKLNPYLNGCLKLYIVNPKLAIGFAGKVEDFEKVLLELLKEVNAKNIIEKAKALKIVNDLDFDLIAADANDRSFYTLRDVNIAKSTVAYIGDNKAYNAYQEAYAKAKSMSPSGIFIGCMKTAFEDVINSGDIDTVGGFFIPLQARNSGFQYLTYSSIAFAPMVLPNNSEVTLNFGTAEHGSYGVELCCSTSKGGSPDEIGLYFVTANFGVIFPRRATGLREAKIEFAKNPAYWALNTYQEQPLRMLISVIMRPEHCRIAAEELCREGKWREALFCYELVENPDHFIENPIIYDRFMYGRMLSLYKSGFTTEAFLILGATLCEKQNICLPKCRELYAQLQNTIHELR